MTVQARIFKGLADIAATRPLVCMIPGGPGLSSRTLGPIDALREDFDVALIDLPGAGGTAECGPYTFEGVVSALEATLLELRRPLLLYGHSFGGILAAQLCGRERLPVAGFIGSTSALSARALQEGFATYQNGMTPEISRCEQAFQADPSRETLTQWLASLSRFYFTSEKRAAGEALLRQDPASARCFLDIFPAFLSLRPVGDLSQVLRRFSFPKFILAGEEDGLISPGSLVEDARNAGARLEVFPGTGHFIGFEEPERLALFFRAGFTNPKPAYGRSNTLYAADR